MRLTNYQGGEDFTVDSVHAVLGEYESAERVSAEPHGFASPCAVTLRGGHR